MKMIWRFFLLLVFLSVCLGAAAQYEGDLSSRDRRAQRFFHRAYSAYMQSGYDQALHWSERALARDDNFLEAHILRAEIFHLQEKYAESAVSYKKLVEIDPYIYPEAHFYLGVALLKTGDYDLSAARLRFFMNLIDSTHALYERANRQLASASFAARAVTAPVPFRPENLGAGVNSRHAEYSPALTADGRTLIFTRKEPLKEEAGSGFEVENFYISEYRDGQWSRARNIGPPINTDENEGAQSISVNGRHLYFTACNRADGIGRCDIYYSYREGENWSEPENIGSVVNSYAWDSQPSISPDGQRLFFTSSRNGNIGITDIWVSTRDEGGSWQKPVNLGPVINTGGREVSPFIHADNKTLYFASDGHPGMGGLDIFFSRMDENGEWSEPVNLGYPVNTHADEFSLVVEASGERAYFASDAKGGYGDMDIYAFELYPQARPDPVAYVKGMVFDKESRKPLAARFVLTDLQSGERIFADTSDPLQGDFLVMVPTGRNIGLSVLHPDYLFFSENFNYTKVHEGARPYVRDIPMERLQEGSRMILRNVFFHTGSHELLPESLPELNRLVEMLRQNPNIKIEFHGHTDNVGTFDFNQHLSEERARSVMEYVVGQGLDASRMGYKGFSYTRPVDSNETDEGRASNRRTEVVVVEANQSE
jgi:outer membrane protein OmpA-like peptidoglycan-associated protein/tetratricopeptide (TPR) repeat protein